MSLDDPMHLAISAARVNMLFQHAFYGQLANRLQVVEANEWCKSICTDGKHLFVNRDFILSLTKKELIYVLGHEALHLAFDHLSRRGFRDKGLWGMAIDYQVNWILRNSNIGKEPTKHVLYERTFDDEVTVYDIYDTLKANSTPVGPTLDEHLDISDIEGDEDEAESSARVVGRDGPPKMTKAEIDQIRQDIQTHIVQMMADPQAAGSMPLGVRRMIDELLEPKLNWREMLRATLLSTIKDDYTYSRMSRRSFCSDAILPGRADAEIIDITCVVDTSGSMSAEMLRDLLSEIKGIMCEFPDFKLRLWTFDTKVYGMKDFTKETLYEIDTYEPEGGGGTTFEVNWEYMKSLNYVPERLVFFTDGYPCSTWGDPDYCDTLWIIHGSAIKQKIKAPFGQTVYYEEPVAGQTY